jgi:hypothetical protein
VQACEIQGILRGDEIKLIQIASFSNRQDKKAKASLVIA